jgi:hypothetical protein
VNFLAQSTSSLDLSPHSVQDQRYRNLERNQVTLLRNGKFLQLWGVLEKASIQGRWNYVCQQAGDAYGRI